MGQVTRTARRCTDCQAEFIPDRPGPFKRCPECGPKHTRAYRNGWKRANAPRQPTTRPCRTCSKPIQRNGRVYATYCSEPCKPRCETSECQRPARKKRLCDAHYMQRERSQELRPVREQLASEVICRTCGGPTGSFSARKIYCSRSCLTYWREHGESFAGPPPCVQCGGAILPKPGRTRRIRSDVKMCARCRCGLRKHGMSVDQLAARDGATCGLCRAPVEMQRRAPDPWCPSVDHRVPRARGGTNDPANLQLAHLICNVNKGAALVP